LEIEMTTEIDTGGPAYPCDTPLTDEGDVLVNPGMTLRDYFAIHSLGGAMTQRGFADELTFEEKAVWVYQMADAMLKARK
jgi:hypothetical protein